METSLLKTKLNIPPTRRQLVQRPQLYERLQEGLNYRLILVSTPAGFGKTTLLSEWIHNSKLGISTAWISLDEGDNDPVRFWEYFITALQIIQPDCGGKTLPLLHSSPQPSVEPILTALINNLAAIVGDFVVVLDDYHLIETQSIHDGITYLIERLPAGMHLVIATRADPPLPLAHFRGRGILMEIGADDLRFNLEDAASLFKELNTPEISMEDVVALNERTEGWAVGLKMAALSMSGQKDISGFITTFTGSQRYVMDYLLEEVLQKQADEIREFLLKTSVLERLSGSLCDTITGCKGSRDILLNLERGHLFIIPLDESRQWYRYEHLFADLLRHQCETAYGKDQFAGLHYLACQWYEDNNFPDDAIHHALAAKDWNTAMRLILPRSEELRNRGEWNTVLGWFKAIPDELIREHHRLYCQYAGCLFTVGESDAAEAALSYLENAAQDDALLQADVAFLMGDIAWVRHDIERAVYLSEKSLSLLPPDNLVMRSRATLGIGLARYLQNDIHEAEKLWTETYDMALRGGDIFLASTTLVWLGTIKGQIINLDGSVELYNKAIEIAGQTQGAAGGQAELSRVIYERNDLEAAAENAALAAEWFERGGVPHNAVLANFICAQVCTIQGDATGAAAAMERMDRAGKHQALNPFYHACHAAFHVLFAIRQNDMEAVDKWSKKLSEYSDALFIEYRYIPGRLLIAQGRKEEAAEYLHDLYEKLVRADAHNLTIEVRMCQALAEDTEESALEFLTEALVRGEPEGFIRSFVDEGKLLAPLLQKAASKGITPNYANKLLTIFQAEERQKQKKKGSVTLLTRREFEILRLLSVELSNKQIADRLNISLSTVKTHVHNILEKMNAKNRMQAILNAKELNLF